MLELLGFSIPSKSFKGRDPWSEEPVAQSNQYTARNAKSQPKAK